MTKTGFSRLAPLFGLALSPGIALLFGLGLPGAAMRRAEAQSAPRPAAATAAPVATLSESKFLSALYSEIAKRTPETSPAGAGEVTASFHVNASGKVDKVTIDKTTSPALAEAVKKILASVAAPPPPGGGMDVGQTFRFRKAESP